MEKKAPNLILGLDIGIGSCGWAILDMANEQVVDMGAHLWDPPQEAKTKTSLAATRRQARSERRNIKRTVDRKKHCVEIFKQYGLMPQDADKDWLQTVKGDIQPIEARVAGLSRILTDREFAQALYNIISRRGYIPHGDSDTDDAEGRKVLKAIAENESLMAGKGYETVGQLLYEKFAAGGASRNKGGDYSQCVTNALLQDEVRTIFVHQQGLGNAKATDEFLSDYLSCLTWQKPSDEHDERIYQTVGKCTYFPEERRAAKACLSYELCTAWERVNHVVVVCPSNPSGNSELTQGENKLPPYIKKRIIDTLFSPIPLPKNKGCTVPYSKVREWLDLPANAFFKGIDADKEKNREISEPKVWRKLRSLLPEALMLRLANDRRLADDICSALAYASSAKSLSSKLDELGLNIDERAAIMALPYSSKLFSDYGNRSLKALNMLIDAFEDVDAITTLSEAEQASGLFGKRLEKPERGYRLPPYIQFDETCKNPVVLRVMGRIRRIVNAVIATYGMPNEIHVELARELKIPKAAREKISRENNERARLRESNAKVLAELKHCAPEELSGTLLRKYELWLEQENKDLYVDEPIDIMRLISDDTYCQIDHILPYSRTCDDSQMNKILVLSKSNQDKKERTPYEWLSAEGKWDEFEKRIAALRQTKYPDKKINRLLETKLDEEKQASFITRNLNDTRYASRSAAQYLDAYLAFPEGRRKKHVSAVAGAATSALRSAWGFAKKDREASDTHHAVDAAIIAACDESRVIGVAHAHERKYYVPKEQRGQLFKDSEPWEGFVEQVSARERTLIPTRMVDHGGTGRLYEDMVYSFAGLNEKGTKGILKRSGKESPSGNYVLRGEGSAVKPDGMMFLRCWWNPETKHYVPEPVYYSDLDAMNHGSYVPRTISSKPRSDWNLVPEAAMQEEPIVIRYGDMIEANNTIGRYKSINTATRKWDIAEPRNFVTSLKQVSTLNQIRTKEGLRVIHEDILGRCYRDMPYAVTSEEQG